jgi:hypothetical protein
MADQLFNKRKGIKKKRVAANREIQPFRYLIVCEGEKTEPLYFEGIRKRINDKYGDKIRVKDIKAERIDIDGTGRNTEDLVKYALKKKQEALIPYGHVWCVFDKDSFSDQQFNSAIKICESNELSVAWSNEAIELWFILHFEFLNTGIDRQQYIDKLDNYFANYTINGGKYEKNLPDIFNILIENGDMIKAIKYSKKLDERYCKEDSPANRKPATKVYELIEELLEYLGEPIK